MKSNISYKIFSIIDSELELNEFKKYIKFHSIKNEFCLVYCSIPSLVTIIMNEKIQLLPNDFISKSQQQLLCNSNSLISNLKNQYEKSIFSLEQKSIISCALFYSQWICNFYLLTKEICDHVFKNFEVNLMWSLDSNQEETPHLLAPFYFKHQIIRSLTDKFNIPMANSKIILSPQRVANFPNIPWIVKLDKMIIEMFFYFLRNKKILFFTSLKYNLPAIASQSGIKQIALIKDSIAQGKPNHPILTLILNVISLVKVLPLLRRIPILEKKVHFIIDITNLSQFRPVRKKLAITLEDPILQDEINLRLNETLGIYEHIHSLLSTVTKKLTKASFISGDAIGLSGILGEVFKNNYLKSLIISHGTHCPPQTTNEKDVFYYHGLGLIGASFSHCAIQTKLAESYFNYYQLKSIPIYTCPIGFGTSITHSKRNLRLEFGIPDNHIIVTHAGTPKAFPGIRFHMYETIDEYIQSIQDLANATSKIQNISVFIRFRPHKLIPIDFMKNILKPYSHCYLVTQGSFADVLKSSNFLVSFSSTTLEEALENSIPVILYGPNRLQYLPIYSSTSSNELSPVSRAGTPRELETLISTLINKNKGKEFNEILNKYYRLSDEQRSGLKKFFS